MQLPFHVARDPIIRLLQKPFACGEQNPLGGDRGIISLDRAIARLA